MALPQGCGIPSTVPAAQFPVAAAAAAAVVVVELVAELVAFEQTEGEIRKETVVPLFAVHTLRRQTQALPHTSLASVVARTPAAVGIPVARKDFAEESQPEGMLQLLLTVAVAIWPSPSTVQQRHLQG